jgi:hypothetical protein
MVIEFFRSPTMGGGRCYIIFEKKNHPPMPSWATENFQLPSDGGGMSNFNLKNSVTI